MWTAIMILSINGQATEIRGAQSLDERACMQAAYKWALSVSMQRPAPKLIDIRCVATQEPER